MVLKLGVRLTDWTNRRLGFFKIPGSYSGHSVPLCIEDPEPSFRLGEVKLILLSS